MSETVILVLIPSYCTLLEGLSTRGVPIVLPGIMRGYESELHALPTEKIVTGSTAFG